MVKSKKIRKTILDIAEKIKKDYNPERIILFGSFAYGKPTRDSDIDMLIVKRTRKKSMDRWFTLKKLCQDPNRGIPFSPLVFTPKELDYRLSLGDQFIKKILEKGQILYQRKWQKVTRRQVFMVCQPRREALATRKNVVKKVVG